MKLFKRISPKYYWISGILLCMVVLFSSVSSRKNGMVDGVKITVKPLKDDVLLVYEKDILNTVESKYGSTLDGLTIREIDIPKIETLAEKNAFVKDAEVYIDAHSKLCINIKQKAPLLRIQDENGIAYYVDNDLQYFPLSRHSSPRILVASGFIPSYDSTSISQGKHILNQLAEITRSIDDNQFAQSNTEQLYVDSEGEIILIPKIGSQKFILGNSERIDEKLNFIRIYYSNIAPKEGWNKYNFVNLKFEGQIVCNKN